MKASRWSSERRHRDSSCSASSPPRFGLITHITSQKFGCLNHPRMRTQRLFMRWLLPLLSLAAIQPVFGELAVYTGSLNTQNGGLPGASSSTRVTQVIDLETGRFV